MKELTRDQVAQLRAVFTMLDMDNQGSLTVCVDDVFYEDANSLHTSASKPRLRPHFIIYPGAQSAVHFFSLAVDVSKHSDLRYKLLLCYFCLNDAYSVFTFDIFLAHAVFVVTNVNGVRFKVFSRNLTLTSISRAVGSGEEACISFLRNWLLSCSLR